MSSARPKSIEYTNGSKEAISTSVYDQVAEQGIRVSRFSQGQETQRTQKYRRDIEPLSPLEQETVQHVCAVMIQAGVSPSDILCVEIPNGCLIEVPRMERRISIQEGICHIFTPTSVRSSILTDSKEGRQAIEEALMYDIDDQEVFEKMSAEERPKNKPGEKVDIDAFVNDRKNILWRQRYIDHKTPGEVRAAEQESERYIAQLMSTVRRKLTAQDLCYLEPEDAKKIRIEKMTLDAIGERLGVRYLVSTELGLLEFAAKVHGADNPIVRRAIAGFERDMREKNALSGTWRSIKAGTSAAILSLIVLSGCGDLSVSNAQTSADASEAALDGELRSMGETKKSENDALKMKEIQIEEVQNDIPEPTDATETNDTKDISTEQDITICADVDVASMQNLKAKSVIGQTENDIMSFTKNDPDNGSAMPNALGLSRPTGVLVDTVHHRIFISDRQNNRIVVHQLDATNKMVDAIADGVLGQANFSGSDSDTTPTGVNGPFQLALDNANNRLFATDFGNNRVLIYDVATITNGESAINVLGQINFTTSVSATTQGGLFSPGELTYDSVKKRLFVADAWNNRVLIYDVATITNGESAINVLGQSDFIASAPSTTQNGLHFPSGLALDPLHGRLFVSDGSNNRVLAYQTGNITNGQNASQVLGQPSFSEKEPSVTQSGFMGPDGLAYDSTTGSLYVADFANNRALIFDEVQAPCITEK